MMLSGKKMLKQIETLKSLKIEGAGIDQSESSFMPSTHKPVITNSSSESHWSLDALPNRLTIEYNRIASPS